MKFQEQYKTEMNSVEPTEAQREKIYAAVYNEINNGVASQPKVLTPNKKKPLSLKALSITGASAACVALVAGFAIGFNINQNNVMDATNGGAISSNAMPNSGTAAPSLRDDVAMESATSDGAEKAESGAPQYSESFSNSLGSGESENSPTASGSMLDIINVDTARLVFFGNCTECILYTNGEAYKYTLIQADDMLDGGTSLALPSENNNLAQTLYITLTSDTIKVVGENQTLIGLFAKQ